MINRPLTDGEITLARTVFRDAIDYAAVTVSDSQYIFFQPEGVAMTPDGNLFMYGCYHADYSQADSGSRGLFIHEMTHVWQFQNKVLRPVAECVNLAMKHEFNYVAAYNFLLDENKDLTRYGMEQQASIVAEYFLVKHEGLASYARDCANKCSDDEKIRLYEKVLEKFLKDPSYAKQSDFPKFFTKRTP